MQADPRVATLAADGGQTAQAQGFSTVIAFSEEGNDDTALLYGSPTGEDTFLGTPLYGRLKGTFAGVPDHFFFRVKNFNTVLAYSNGGGSDVAALYDSPGGDTYDADPNRGVMNYEDGSTVEAEGFPSVHAFSSNDGNDTANLFDLNGSPDLFRSWVTEQTPGELSTEAKMVGEGFYSRVKDFDKVVAGASDSDDRAELYDSPGDDIFDAHADRATMSYEDGRSVEANGFPQVHGLATNDGTDTATLFGLAGSSDRFRSRPTDARMSGNDYYNRAKFFERVVASASDSTDKAALYDSPGADNFEAYSDRGTMTHEDGTVVEANDFSQLHAFAIYGGDDTATLYDTTADLATSYPTWLKGGYGESKLYNGPAGFFNRAVGFEEVRAALRGGDDRARLYDDPARADHLVVPFLGDVDYDPCKAKLHNDQRAIYLDDFLTLYAYTSQDFVDDEDVDPAYQDQVICDGNWADAP